MDSGQDVITVEQSQGVATVRLRFPEGKLSWPQLAQLLAVVEPLAANPSVEALELLSDHPAGLGLGTSLEALTEEEDRTRFARQGQQLLARFAALPIPTLAVLRGACLGPAFELALACDYRIAISGPDAWLGWPDLPPAWGGRFWASRLTSRRTLTQLLNGHRLTAREAYSAGLVDDVFTERRAKVEREHWRMRMLQSGRKRTGPACPWSLAADRQQFRQWEPDTSRLPGRRLFGQNPIEHLIVVGSHPIAASITVEAAMRGIQTASVGLPAESLNAAFTEALRRGRVTPLEADQARRRLNGFDRPADVILFTDDRLPHWDQVRPYLGPRTIVTTPAAGLPQLAMLDRRPDRQLGLTLYGAEQFARLVTQHATNPALLERLLLLLNGLGFECQRECLRPTGEYLFREDRWPRSQTAVQKAELLVEGTA